MQDIYFDNEPWGDQNELEICPYCREDSFSCGCSSDVCCYDPRYTGAPGSCKCAEQAEIDYRSDHWFYKRYNSITNRIFKFYQYLKIQCDNVKKLFQKKDEELPF